MAIRLIPQGRLAGESASAERGAARRWRWRLRVLHSLTGLLPLSALMLLQLWTLAKVSAGPQQLQQAWRSFASLCAQPWWLLPLGAALLFHAGYGLLLARARPVVGRYPVNGAWMHLFQRISAVAVLLWLLLPLVTLGWPVYRGELQPEDAAALSQAALSSTAWGVPWHAFGYLLGLAALVFHGFNGAWLALVRWGLLRKARARARVGAVLAVLGTCAFLAAAHGVLYLATGWRAYVPAASPAAEPTSAPAAVPSGAVSAAPAAVPPGVVSAAPASGPSASREVR